MPRPRQITPQSYQPTNPQAFPTPPRPNNLANPRPQMSDRPLPNFNMSKSDLFKRLSQENLIAPRPGRVVTPPYPRWYNPNITCEYHSNTPGHSIENCYGFRMVVWQLLDNKVIEIQEEAGPSIKNNPLPKYNDRQVSALEMDFEEDGLDNVEFSIKDVVGGLRMAGYEVVMEGKGGRRVLGEGLDESLCMCQGHQGEHHMEECPEFKMFVQICFKLGILQSCKKVKDEKASVNMVSSKPLVFKVPAQKPALVFKTPSPFYYHGDDAVPWKYDTEIEGTTRTISDSETTGVVTNVIGVGGMTRSGRCYSPADHSKTPKGSSAEDAKEKDEVEEEGEFLKIMKQSEYDVMEQLKKTPAKISLFTLIMTSEAHRNALRKVLDQSFVSKDITPEKVEHIVNAIRSSNMITFAEEEIAPSSSGRPKALHITLKCQGYIVAKVLIDGGSALNVLPYSTFQQLPVDPSAIEPSSMIVRAFDGSKREIMGNISLQLEIGPSIFTTEFQVMDMEPPYTMLLGRPWIHEARAVPSTLHQKLKYIAGGKLITVKGEEEMLISKPVNVPYVDSTEQSFETLFQSLEIVEREEQAKGKNPLVTRMLYKNGYQDGKGLGIHLQGIKDPITLPPNTGRLGLGYKIDEKEPAKRPDKIPHIRNTFPFPAEVMALESALESPDRVQLLIHPSSTGEEINNWESESLPDQLYFE